MGGNGNWIGGYVEYFGYKVDEGCEQFCWFGCIVNEQWCIGLVGQFDDQFFVGYVGYDMVLKKVGCYVFVVVGSQGIFDGCQKF